MKRYFVRLVAGLVLAWAGDGAAAPALPAAQAGLPSILGKILGDSSVFSAKAHVRVTGKSPSDSMQLRMDFFFSRGSMRAEINMAEVKSDALPEAMMASLKQIGMDRVVTIMRPGNQPAWILYPNLNASLEVPPAKAAGPDRPGKESFRETKLGEETVGGRSCDKWRVVYRDSQSRTHEAVVWRARDSRRFPWQIQTTHAGTTTAVSYSEVQFVDVAPGLFALPAGYTKYESIEKVMEEALKRLLTGTRP